ncbi:MAG TPA: hypothetical protein VF065_10120 [Ilumatobacter sp.]
MSVLLTFGTIGAAGRIGDAEASSPPPTEAPPSTVPDPTINEFIPEERAISDCISAVPKPGCGSESRSDWHQWLVFIALAGGMAFVGWRVVAGLRKQRTEPDRSQAPTH